tara:strand:+ start:3527 stop:3925 length:399 start_codon:yes stop_codon:yes gene_type:complete
MALSTRYSGIPAVPTTGVDEWQSRMLSAIKENVELLAGIRGESDLASKAITKAQVSISDPVAQVMTNVSAAGAGTNVLTSFSISGDVVTVTGQASVPVLDDYTNLVVDVQSLANDVANLRATVQLLLTQLRS